MTRNGTHPNGDRRTSGGVMWLFGQMMILPFRTFVYGMERLLETMRDMQRAGDRGMEVMAGGSLAVAADAPPESGAPQSEIPDRDPGQAGEQPIIEEKRQMDKELNDDSLKLVRFKILFVKRDFEHAFPEQEELVSDNIDGTAFTAWKIAEFIQRLQRHETEVPHKWRNKNYPGGQFADGGHLTGLPEDDKKYLRVYFEVLERYKREKFRYEEEQIDVLREIRDRMEPRPSGAD